MEARRQREVFECRRQFNAVTSAFDYAVGIRFKHWCMLLGHYRVSISVGHDLAIDSKLAAGKLMLLNKVDAYAVVRIMCSATKWQTRTK